MRLIALILLLISGVPPSAVISAFAPSAFAARQVISCSHAYLTLEQVTHDSSVELEMGLSRQLLGMLTSQNGKVSGVLSGERIPEHVRAELFQKYHLGAEDIPWESLTLDERQELLVLQAQSRGKSFSADRKMHGMRVKDKVSLTFKEPTEFLGQTYPAGTHEIDVSQVLSKNVVEYQGPEQLPYATGVELHFRGSYPAGTLSRYARVFQDAVNADLKHQHVHIVAKVPIDKLKANPTLESARMADFFRRANLFSEIAFIFDGKNIGAKKLDGIIYFDNLSRGSLSSFTRQLYETGQGEELAFGDSLKMSWVGVRGSDKYDAPNLWGLEYRNVYGAAHRPFIEQTLDSLQWSMEHQDYGVPTATMQRWVKKFVGRRGNPGPQTGDTWYRKYNYADDAVKAIPPEFHESLDLRVLHWRLQKHIENHHELQMLVHNWDKDPLFFESPSALAKIKEEQKKGLLSLQNGMHPTEVMQNFLWDSGIAAAVAKSLRTDLRLAAETKGRLQAAERLPGSKPDVPTAEQAQRSFWNWLSGRNK